MEANLSTKNLLWQHTSANPRPVLDVFKSTVESARRRTVSADLWYSKGCKCSKGWNVSDEPLAGQLKR